MRKRPFLVNDQTNVVHLEPLRKSRDKRLKELERIIYIQCQDGIWNLDKYMMGVANGLLLAQGILDDAEPKFLSAPDYWEADKPIDLTDGVNEALACAHKCGGMRFNKWSDGALVCVNCGLVQPERTS